MAAGDTCYLRDGVTATAIDNFQANLELESGGTSANPVAFVGYPGATATIGGSGAVYGLRVPNIGVSANFITIAELFFNNTEEAMNPSNSNNWRIVGNNFQCPNANGQTGCFETNEVSQVAFFGNETTNVGVPAANKQQHAVYFSSDTNHVEAAWNYIHNNRSCRAMQFHSSPLFGGGGGDPTGFNQFDLSVHDNLIHDDPCDGINFATVDPSKGKVEAYNNVIYHVGIGPAPGGEDSGDDSCIYMAYITNNGSPGQGTVEIYNNTLYDCGPFQASFPNNGTFNIAGGTPGLVARLRNNIMYQIGSEPFGNGGGWNSTYVSGSNNVVFSSGTPGPIPTFLAGNVRSNPQFVNLSLPDFHLGAGSPAIDMGVTTPAPIDFDGFIRPQGPAFDIGAYEFLQLVPSVALSSSLNPTQVGQQVIFKAVVSSTAGTPTGSVTFKDGGSTLGTVALTAGVATFATSGLTTGAHSITAAYGGDSFFSANTSAPLTQNVSLAFTTTGVTSSQNPTTVSTSINLTANVNSTFGGTPTGTVSFVDGSTPLAGSPATLSSGTVTIPASFSTTGLHTITVTYNGDSNHSGSGAVLQQIVNGSGSTPTTTSLNYVQSPTPLNSPQNQQQVLFRHSIALTATVSPAPSGTSDQVIFMLGTSVLGTASVISGVATLPSVRLGVGSHVVKAYFIGDETNAPSTAQMVINQSGRPR